MFHVEHSGGFASEDKRKRTPERRVGGAILDGLQNYLLVI
jgi:hypothetical protein